MSNRLLASVCAFALASAALAGCVSPPAYGPMGGEGGQFGYSDTRNADGSYTIRVVTTTAAQAHEFWDRRAGELCGDAGYQKIIYRAEIPVVTQSGYVSGPNGYGGSYTQDVYGSLILEGHARCGAAAPATSALDAAPQAVTESAPATPPQP